MLVLLLGKAEKRPLLRKKCKRLHFSASVTVLIDNPYSARFVIQVSCIAVLFAIVFLVVGVTTAYKGNPDATVTFAVSVLVAFVPEGLPSVVTMLLSIAAKRMAKQNVLVKDLQGVETLGVYHSPIEGRNR